MGSAIAVDTAAGRIEALRTVLEPSATAALRVAADRGRHFRYPSCL